MADEGLDSLASSISALRSEIAALRAEVQKTKGAGSLGSSEMGVGPHTGAASLGAAGYMSVLSKYSNVRKYQEIHGVIPSVPPGTNPNDYDKFYARLDRAAYFQRNLLKPHGALKAPGGMFSQFSNEFTGDFAKIGFAFGLVRGISRELSESAIKEKIKLAKEENRSMASVYAESGVGIVGSLMADTLRGASMAMASKTFREATMAGGQLVRGATRAGLSNIRKLKFTKLPGNLGTFARGLGSITKGTLRAGAYVAVAEAAIMTVDDYWNGSNNMSKSIKDLKNVINKSDFSNVNMSNAIAERYVINKMVEVTGFGRAFGHVVTLGSMDDNMVHLKGVIAEEMQNIKEADKLASEAKQNAINGNFETAKSKGKEALKKAGAWGSAAWADPVRWFSMAEQASVARRAFGRWNNSRIQKRTGD